MADHRITIAVVDDDPFVLNVVQVLLQRSYVVLTATDGEDALDLLHQHGGDIDLFLCDIVMPGFDGFEVAKRIIAQGLGIRVMLMSGFSTEHISQTIPGVPFLAKPFTRDVLETAVAEALSAKPPSHANSGM